MHFGSSNIPLETGTASLIPDDPFNAHTPAKGLTHEEIRSQKEANSRELDMHAQMIVDKTSHEMATIGIYLMQEFHFNHFRDGSPAEHYTAHTTAVAKEAFISATRHWIPQITETLYTSSGEPLDVKAVAFVIGALHDAREDFYKNFEYTEKAITPAEGAKVVDARIYEAFSPVIGEKATLRIIRALQTLSLTNQDEFPDRKYIAAIRGDFYARCVKQADYLHNLATFPDFCPEYPLLIIPAQFGPIVEDTVYRPLYDEKILQNLVKFDPARVVPWDRQLKEKGITVVEHVIDLFEKYNEPNARDRIVRYYDDLRHFIEDPENGAFLERNNLSQTVLLDKLRLLQKQLVPSLPVFLRSNPDEDSNGLPRTSKAVIGLIPLRILGPMQAWGGEITCAAGDQRDLERVINETSRSLGFRIPGYFTSPRPSPGTVTFHISRYGRRAEDPVPPVSSYQDMFSELQLQVASAGLTATGREETFTSRAELRVVLGLEEGYFEGRRKEVLAKVREGTVTSLPELEASLHALLGNYSGPGIEITETATFEAAVAALEAGKLSTVHVPAEVKLFLGHGFRVESAKVFSAAPAYTTPYQEPAVLITAPATGENFERLVQLADQFKQARFSVENLGRGTVVNVEIEQFSQARSAAMI